MGIEYTFIRMSKTHLLALVYDSRDRIRSVSRDPDCNRIPEESGLYRSVDVHCQDPKKH